MKHSLLALFLMVSAAPLFANDQDGDMAYIPSYRELVREGYGPREHEQLFRPVVRVAPKPTQAFYGRGYTVYYGYTTVPIRAGDNSMLYAFGSPVEYFRRMMPLSDVETNLSRYAVTVSNADYGHAVAEGGNQQHPEATTVVQSTTAKTTPVAATKPGPVSAAPSTVGEKATH